MGVDYRHLSTEDVNRWSSARWRARTDLLWLCQNVLGYKNVETAVHGPVIEMLQRFPCPKSREEARSLDNLNAGTGRWDYTPHTRMTELVGSRRNLILDPRGHLKTTVNAQAHTIQWLLNYPDAAIQVVQSNTEKAEIIIGEIKAHFMKNHRLRELFPEYCPPLNAKEWGTKSEFTVNARRAIRKESTVMIGSIDKASAGLHFDVMKFSDIVDPINVITDGMIRRVIANYYMMENLLVAPVFWIDVEGTRYTHNDLYTRLIKQWLSEKEGEREYCIHVRGCWIKQFALDEKNPTYTPDRLDEINAVDKDGNLIAIWPIDNEDRVRFPRERLERMRKRDPYIFSAQQLNHPIGGRAGVTVFPVIKGSRPRPISPENFRNVRYRGTEVVVDTADKDKESSNMTCITTGSWDRAGRLYIRDIQVGHFNQTEMTRRIFATAKWMRADRVKIEETSFVLGLKPTLEREMFELGYELPLEFLSRDNKVRKVERIETTLQDPYTRGDIIFLTSINPEAWTRLLEELREFPLGDNDDILDTLADFYQGEPLVPRQRPEAVKREVNTYLEMALGIENPWDPMVDAIRSSSTMQIGPNPGYDGW